MRGQRVGAKAEVFTLWPLDVLEAGGRIYDEFTTGPFWFRIGDMLTADERRRLVVTSPKTVGELLQRKAPAAILLGFYEEDDKPILRFAEENAYKPTPIGSKITLWIWPRPAPP